MVLASYRLKKKFKLLIRNFFEVDGIVLFV